MVVILALPSVCLTRTPRNSENLNVDANPVWILSVFRLHTKGARGVGLCHVFCPGENTSILHAKFDLMIATRPAFHPRVCCP